LTAVAYGAPGRPLSEPRSPFAVRRADRAAFQVLKEQARQSPAATERRARNAQKVLKTRARKKVKKLVRGEAESPFTLDQLRQLNPAEIDVLVGYVRARLDSLTPVQRARYRRNAGVFVTAWLTDQQLRDLAEFELPSVPRC
jgi:hypothetical protein